MAHTFLENELFGNELLVQPVHLDLRVLAFRLTSVLLVVAALATLIR